MATLNMGSEKMKNVSQTDCQIKKSRKLLKIAKSVFILIMSFGS